MTVTGIFCMQADWSQAFDIANTKPRPFLREDESSILVPTMYCISEGIRVAAADGVDLASLSYGNGGLAMLVVVPKRGDGLRALEGSLGRQTWNEWRVAFARASRVRAHVYMPRFRIEQELSLREPLSAMGASDHFDKERADLRWVTAEQPGVRVDSLVQHAGIIADEKGTEAWSVTHGDFVSMGAPPPPLPMRVFRADRPFLFFVYEAQRDTILFMGRVTFAKAAAEPPPAVKK
ncbi:MAG: hypothetical protein BWK77_02120 [Verrucomicrobia bacterium A1]|nr:MAG: hypothetical protein BWK77_02120 [Verrucomicrobia bacterium A1]